MQIVNQPKAFYQDREVQVGSTRDGFTQVTFHTEPTESMFVKLEDVEVMSHAVLI